MTLTRVNGKQLESNKGQNVRVVGSVVSSEGNSAVIQTPDDVKVTIRGGDQFDSSKFNCKNVEVIGRPQGDGVMEMITATDFGDNFDLKLYGEMLNVTAQHSTVF